MSLVRYNWPSLSNFFDDDWQKSNSKNAEWMPVVNVSDNEDGYEIEVAAPGLKKDDFEISVEHSRLTISGKTEKKKRKKGRTIPAKSSVPARSSDRLYYQKMWMMTASLPIIKMVC